MCLLNRDETQIFVASRSGAKAHAFPKSLGKNILSRRESQHNENAACYGREIFRRLEAKKPEISGR